MIVVTIRPREDKGAQMIRHPLSIQRIRGSPGHTADMKVLLQHIENLTTELGMVCKTGSSLA